MDQPETVAHYRCLFCPDSPLREGGVTAFHRHRWSVHPQYHEGEEVAAWYEIVLLPPAVLPEPIPYWDDPDDR